MGLFFFCPMRQEICPITNKDTMLIGLQAALADMGLVPVSALARKFQAFSIMVETSIGERYSHRSLLPCL